jgi:hypothetical protein
MKVNLGKFRKNASKVDVVKIESHDTYNLNLSAAMIILPMLIHHRHHYSGIPSEFANFGGKDYDDQRSFEFYTADADDYHEQGVAAWNEILDKMIWSFHEKVIDDDSRYYSGQPKHGGRELYHERVQEGYDLFAKYFDNLWD